MIRGLQLKKKSIQDVGIDPFMHFAFDDNACTFSSEKYICYKNFYYKQHDKGAS